jgi:hypothetical protein
VKKIIIGGDQILSDKERDKIEKQLKKRHKEVMDEKEQVDLLLEVITFKFITSYFLN